MGTSLGLCGWPGNGHDIGGFKGPMPDAELLVRWLQSSVCQPRFCIHSWNDGGTCTEPWSHPAVLPAVRDAVQFRYRLLPHLYTLQHFASRAGAPLVRPLVYHFPDDARARGTPVDGALYDGDGTAESVYVREAASCDYMLGNALLVAPVYTPGVRARPVYLPGGAEELWCEWATGTWYAGGGVVPAAAAPLDSGLPPLFVRDGTLLPLLPAAAVAREGVCGTADLASVAPVFHLFLRRSTSATAVMFEDDGVSLNGRGARLLVHATVRDDIVSVDAYCIGPAVALAAVRYSKVEVVLGSGALGRAVVGLTLLPRPGEEQADGRVMVVVKMVAVEEDQ